ncbi:MAG: glycosyltransferase family 39 protein, partial [Casimicrobiaceae bacterium]
MEPARHRRNGIRTILTVPWVSGVLVAVLLITSFIEQRQLLEQYGSADRLMWLAIFSAAAGMMLAISTTVPRSADPSFGGPLLTAPLKLARPILWSASLCFAAISSWLVHSGGAPILATVAWLLGITLIIAAANDIAVSRGSDEPLRQAHSKRVAFALILLGIMIVAAILRVPGLETLPGYVHNDEAANGLMARSIVAGEVPSLFRNGWASLPILGYVWEALFLKLFGDSLTSLRLASAVVGIGSIALVALLGKELFNVRTGLIAAALVTFFHMHIHFSRVGHHYMQALFCLMFTLYLLVRALRYGQPLAAVGTGILLSVDVQVYFAARIAYVIVPLVVIYELLIVGRHLLRSRLS